MLLLLLLLSSSFWCSVCLFACFSCLSKSSVHNQNSHPQMPSLSHAHKATPAASISTRGPFPLVSCFPMASSPHSVLDPGHLVAKFFSITFAYSPSSALTPSNPMHCPCGGCLALQEALPSMSHPLFSTRASQTQQAQRTWVEITQQATLAPREA